MYIFLHKHFYNEHYQIYKIIWHKGSPVVIEEKMLLKSCFYRRRMILLRHKRKLLRAHFRITFLDYS